MSKSTRALIQIGVALMLAMTAGVLIFMWTSKLTQQQAKPEVQAPVTVDVVVAKENIARGYKLTEEMLAVRKFTPDSRPAGSFATIEELEGRVLRTNIGMNEAVTEVKLADASVIGGGVSAMIEPGKRAMAVKGNIVMGLAGFVRPGDRVDVLVTIEEEYERKQWRGGHSYTDTKRRFVTKLVLEQLKVLATGTELSPPDENGQTASVEVYTVEVTPQESERLALAATRGTLNFALRNELDENNILTTGQTIPEALNALRPKAKKKAAAKKTASYRPKQKVQLITGASTKTLTF